MSSYYAKFIPDLIVVVFSFTVKKLNLDSFILLVLHGMFIKLFASGNYKP